jgi:hypothetical protein
MPLFLEGFREMNKRHKAFDCDEQGFIKTLVGVLGTGPKNVIGLVLSDGIAVGYGVGFDDTPTYCDKRHFLFWALYVKPEWSKLASKVLFEAGERYAKKQGYHVLRANNGRFNGSSFKFFEKVLGMRRNRIEFTKQIL